jgi:hypothetical protein
MSRRSLRLSTASSEAPTPPPAAAGVGAAEPDVGSSSTVVPATTPPSSQRGKRKSTGGRGGRPKRTKSETDRAVRLLVGVFPSLSALIAASCSPPKGWTYTATRPQSQQMALSLRSPAGTVAGTRPTRCFAPPAVTISAEPASLPYRTKRYPPFGP